MRNGYSLFLELKMHEISSSVRSFSDHCKYCTNSLLMKREKGGGYTWISTLLKSMN